MSSVIPFSFNEVESCVVTINNKPGRVPGKCARHLNVVHQKLQTSSKPTAAQKLSLTSIK